MTVSVGIDIAEERKGLDLVALDGQRAIVDRITRATVTDVGAAILRIAPDVVCIDAPPEWARRGKCRTAERSLRTIGITAFCTPTDPGDHSFYRWMRVGFAVFNSIADRYPNYRTGPIKGTALEVFPEASATLLTGTLCPKGQKNPFRRAVLRAHGIDVALLPSIDAVDAALAALTGLRALEGQFTAIGDPTEGVIVVPVAALPATPLVRPACDSTSKHPKSEPIGDTPTESLRRNTKARPVTGVPGLTAHRPRLCECGCGASVRKRFLPGHDAKLKSRLLREARAGDAVAEQQLRQLGWLPSS